MRKRNKNHASHTTGAGIAAGTQIESERLWTPLILQPATTDPRAESSANPDCYAKESTSACGAPLFRL